MDINENTINAENNDMPEQSEETAGFKFNPTVSSAFENGEKQKNCSVGKSIVLTVFAAIALAFHLTIIIMMLCGTIEFFGKDMNVVNAVMFVIDLFGINLATVYRSLMGAAAGVFYFVGLGFGIKWFVVAVISFARNLRAGLKTTVDVKSGLLNVVDDCLKTLALFFVFILVTDLLSRNVIGGGTIFIMVFGGMLYVARDIVRDVCRTDRANSASVISILLAAVRNAVIYVAVCLMINVLNVTAVKDFLYGADAMFNGNVFSIDAGLASSLYALYDKIVEPVLLTIITVMFAAIMSVYIRYDNTYMKDEKRGKITLLVFSAITLGVNLIFKCFVVAGSSSASAGIESFTSWLGTVRLTLLPIVLLSAVFVFTDIISPNVMGFKPVAAPPAKSTAA